MLSFLVNTNKMSKIKFISLNVSGIIYLLFALFLYFWNLKYHLYNFVCHIVLKLSKL